MFSCKYENMMKHDNHVSCKHENNMITWFFYVQNICHVFPEFVLSVLIISELKKN